MPEPHALHVACPGLDPSAQAPSMPAVSADALRGRRILILIVGHLASAPRVQKEARALRAAGAEVVIRGNWSDPALVAEDLALAQALGVDFAPVTDRRRQGRLLDRVRHRVAHELYRHIGLLSCRVLGPGAPELLQAAIRINADLTMVHSEPGLWVGRRLLARGQRVGVDFEDWFSHDQLPADRDEPVRQALQTLERHLLQRAHCSLTTTCVMARALAEDAGVRRLPSVVRNCFPSIAHTDADADTCAGNGVRSVTDAVHGVQVTDRVHATGVSFYWFSQTIGPGRGLEQLGQALPRLRGDWQLCLRGNMEGYRDWFDHVFPFALRARIHCLEPVSNAELPLRSRAHDVGLALEVPYCPNKQLTASNKIHEYLRCGLAVIATDTLGQQEVMRASPGAGMLVPPDDPAALAAAMQAMLDGPRMLRETRRQSAHAGRTVWDWALHEPVLLQALAHAVAR